MRTAAGSVPADRAAPRSPVPPRTPPAKCAAHNRPPVWSAGFIPPCGYHLFNGSTLPFWIKNVKNPDTILTIFGGSSRKSVGILCRKAPILHKFLRCRLNYFCMTSTGRAFSSLRKALCSACVLPRSFPCLQQCGSHPSGLQSSGRATLYVK